MTSEVLAKSGNLGKNSVARRKIRFGRYQRHNFTLTETLSDEDSVSLSSVASLNSEESAESENPRPENIFNSRSLGTFLSDSIPLNKKSSSNVGVKCDQSVSRSDSSEALPVKKSASASKSVQQKNSLNFKIHQVYKSRACPLTDEETVSLSSAESSAYSCRVSDFGDSSRTQLRSPCKNSALETARAGLTKCNLGFRGQAYARGKLKDDTEDDSVSFSSADSDRRESGLYRDLRSRALRSIAKSGKRDETRSNVSFERFHRLTDEETVSLSSLENNASVSASSSVSSGGADRCRVSRHFFERNEDEALQVANTATSEDENCESGAVEINESFVQIPLEGEERSEEFEYGSDLSDKDDFDPKKPSFCFIRGSDPRIATCRGKLQNKRSKLNQEINKELRLRAGAENLFKATTNRKLRETVALELSFVNSNLQLLKEQLAELNSSVEIYQGDSPEPVMPMIPLGLKETKEIDFREPFKDFILEHYSEDGSTYEIAIAEFMEMRQAMRTPNRDNSGIALLFQYYNQLYFVERRFFPPDRSLGIYFEWYDSLTGVPSCQKTVAFEKACVLFNMAAVYTQMGAKQDRLTEKGLDQAVDSFLRAAGTYTYIQENFTNAPSMDLAPHMLDMLVHLMLAQARECLFEKLELQSEEKRNVDVWLDLAQESAQLAQVYETVHSLITMASVREYVPYSWVSLVQVKHQHYAGLAHFHGAIALLSKSLAQLSERSKDMLHYLHVEPDYKTPSHIQLDTDEQRKQLGKAHLKSALQMHEESQRLQRMCRELRSKKALSRVLARTFDDVAETLADTDEDDAFSEILEAPCIQPSTKFQLSLTPPDFAHLPVEDLFKQLGPVAIFSAKHHWTAPRSVRLQRGSSHDVGFGFSVRGDSPVIVAAVDQGSLAHFGGMKEGDFIVAIGNCDVKWSQHDHVVKLIKEAGDSLSLKLVTPMDRNYLKPKTKSNQSEIGSGTGTNSSSNSGTGTQGNSPNGSVNTHKKLTWNPFKKHRERETSFNIISR